LGSGGGERRDAVTSAHIENPDQTKASQALRDDA